MRNVLCKVYAAFSPIEENCFSLVQEAGERAMGSERWLFQEGDLLRISFEGAFFPEEDVLAALASCLPAASQGKLDYLNMEDWTLTRHVFGEGRFASSTRSLNQVMDYSGH